MLDFLCDRTCRCGGIRCDPLGGVTITAAHSHMRGAMLSCGRCGETLSYPRRPAFAPTDLLLADVQPPRHPAR